MTHILSYTFATLLIIAVGAAELALAVWFLAATDLPSISVGGVGEYLAFSGGLYIIGGMLTASARLADHMEK